jgi:hypothetical protein
VSLSLAFLPSAALLSWLLGKGLVGGLVFSVSEFRRQGRRWCVFFTVCEPFSGFFAVCRSFLGWKGFGGWLGVFVCFVAPSVLA